MKKPGFKRIFAMILFVSLLAMWGCTQKGEKKTDLKKATIPVRTVAVSDSDCSIPIRTLGILASKAEMKLSFKIGGIIEKIAVDEGQIIKKGSLLARLNLAEIDSQVENARSMFEKAERDLQRVENLYQDKAVTLENLQDARTARDIAKSQLNAATFNYTHATIKAPSNGKVLKRFAEENEMIGPGIPVIYFGSLEKDWVTRVSLADRDILSIGLDDPALIEFDAYPGEVFTGHVTEIAEAASVKNGLFEVELQMKNKDLPLKSGLIAHVTITPVQRVPCLRVPLAAVVEADGTKASIFVPDKSKTTAIKRIVMMKHLYDDNFAAEIPRPPIVEVITDGAQYCIDGSSISIVSDNSSVDGVQQAVPSSDSPGPKE